MERIQKIIAARGLCSRRAAEELLRAGRVTRNGKTAALGDSAEPGDVLLVDGRPLPEPPEPVYLMLHKPRGYVTTLSDERGRKTVRELTAGCGCKVVPVGRLDMDSEGLLLLTNDGALANALMHPSHRVDKVYRVLVAGYAPGKETLLARPVVLDGYRIAPPGVRLLGSRGEEASLEVTIHEGRNRQVRRMCELAGLTVRRLKRVAEGPLTLGGLPAGAWRYLTPEEIKALRCAGTEGEGHV